VVRNSESGEYKQVGSSCLKDFFQGRDPHAVAKYAELLFDMGTVIGGYSNQGQSPKYINLKEYLNIVDQCIKKFGFMGAKKANEIAEETGMKPMTTAQEAYDHLYSSYIPYNERIHSTKESEEIVTEALNWIQRQPASNDYMHNLITICSNEYIDHRGMGTAASLIPTYYKATHEVKTPEKVETEFLGNINEKIEVKVILNKIFSYETQFGVNYIYKFKDEQGNTIVWGTAPKDFKENGNYKIKGTVKEHKIYNGEKQTQLTRCKVESL
jgi:hypothetical protein